MAQTKSQTPTAVRKVSNALRGRLLKCAAGELIGSQEELASRYRVSRLKLFLKIIRDFCGRVRNDADVYMHHPERIRASLQLRLDLARAILAGDVELAELIAARSAAGITAWLMEDVGLRRAGQPFQYLDLESSTGQVVT
jgi:hypothetical protein